MLNIFCVIDVSAMFPAAAVILGQMSLRHQQNQNSCWLDEW